ncbi:DNA-binding XRE family transcriptional regulator [Thermolongibacillus altinsuensis]|uniref:DNA-binding XRE family transcriptional regulator n=1 Tax=Thermolongibacillus altinsuensis TaxID=575256 RepID=A0A4V2QAK2_9BACL|nr:helix-turn-helix transcriptional regulator [Thermolongibacillus altinsuensis]TCL52812.1 DNA-binding XRE family transcriptional regulator [Thermolongibacillus altinsuensis]
MKQLGDRLKWLRKERNWTQEQLAQKLNVSRSQISKWENGDQLPDIKSIEEISNLFNVSIDFLLGRNHVTKEILHEIQRTYGTDDIDEELLEVIRYLKQNPKLARSLYVLQSLPAKKRKRIETIVITTIQELLRAFE